MHLEYWGLKKPPFGKEPDPEFVYSFPGFEEVLSRFRYAVERNKGAALLTGEQGYGKTTLLVSLAKKLSADGSPTALVTGPFPHAIEFLEKVVRRFGFSQETGGRKLDALHLIRNMVFQNAKRNHKTVLLIDDAEGLSEETREEVRLLLNTLSDHDLPFTIVLAGLPLLRKMVEESKDLDQRIAMRCRIRPMDFVNVSAYISHRLKTAGSARRIFTFEAMAEIHGLTAGIPSKINELCNHCLEKGFASKASAIDADIVHRSLEIF